MKMTARHGQSILEYTIIVGIVTLALVYMGTSIKRGVQSLLKVTADQVGNQQNSDQDFSDTQQGFMEASNSSTQEINNKQIVETGYIPSSGTAVYLGNTSYNDSTYTMTNTITNGGFSPNQ
jgi:Flp pilus assembly pilin Flp